MKGLRRSWHRRPLKLQRHSGGKTRRRRPTASRPVWPAPTAVWPVLRPVWPVCPVSLGIPPEPSTREGRALSWPSMRRRELPRNRRGSWTRPRIWSLQRNIRSNRILIQVKVIVWHSMARLLHGIAIILTFIHSWIIVWCIWYSISSYVSKSYFSTKTDCC